MVADPEAEAAYVELLLALPREVTAVLREPCPDCRGPLTDDAFTVDCSAHTVYQAEAMRDAIFLLGARR